MNSDALARHIEHPCGRGHIPDAACTGAAGGAACGDLIRISITVDPDDSQGRIIDAGFDASGCGTAIAAGSATVELCKGAGLLSAARIGAAQIARELGGLSSAKLHAAELAADALHRALGESARRVAQIALVEGRTVVAMSGGVDSAVAALLAADRGQETVGVTLELWSDPENDGERSCCSAQSVRAARSLAHSLNMPHLSIDLRAEFREGVVDPWLDGHAAGLTPNPCVRCNGQVRLDAMLELAERLGADTLTTGHYARITDDPSPLLQVAADEHKDQSYVLAALSSGTLSRLRFPLGAMNKAQVREIARAAGMPVAAKPDSQDLCFLAGTRAQVFLARHGGIDTGPGEVVDSEGRRVGEHDGYHTVTVGQRRGLRLHQSQARYVLKVDAARNLVTVGGREELLSDTIALRDLTLHRPGCSIDAVKVRSRGRRLACRGLPELAVGCHPHAEIQLADLQERTAPGQLACLYEGELIVGHGTIDG